MDVIMPKMDGLQATEWIMRHSPRPVLIVSNLVGKDADLNFKALQSGALDLVTKPTAREFAVTRARQQFVRKVRLLSEIPVVTRRHSQNLAVSVKQEAVSPVPDREPGETSLLAIGASTGGPPALLTLLSAFGGYVPFPVVIVQHMSEGFIGGMAEWLSESTRLKVKLARHSERLEPNVVYLAPDRNHLRIVRDSFALSEVQSPVGHVPSVDVLFDSIAECPLAPSTVAVLLTGMGMDGAHGLGSVRRAGGRTIAQDEATSVVFGMPKAAIDLGAAQEVLPIDRIGVRLRAIASRLQT
jgi:two-component system chemotaxis response regulator CheB